MACDLKLEPKLVHEVLLEENFDYFLLVGTVVVVSYKYVDQCIAADVLLAVLVIPEVIEFLSGQLA